MDCWPTVSWQTAHSWMTHSQQSDDSRMRFWSFSSQLPHFQWYNTAVAGFWVVFQLRGILKFSRTRYDLRYLRWEKKLMYASNCLLQKRIHSRMLPWKFKKRKWLCKVTFVYAREPNAWLCKNNQTTETQCDLVYITRNCKHEKRNSSDQTSQSQKYNWSLNKQILDALHEKVNRLLASAWWKFKVSTSCNISLICVSRERQL